MLNVTTPTLIMAGEHDWRCPASLAETYYVTLRKIGVPAELVIYQNEHHATTRPKRSIDRLSRICRWFAAHGGLSFNDDSAEGYPSGRDGTCQLADGKERQRGQQAGIWDCVLPA